MNSENTIFWHRKDLRIEDNIGLIKTLNKSNYVIGVYFLNEIYLKSFEDCPKAWFIIESLKELKLNWKKLGSELIIINGEFQNHIKKLCLSLKVSHVAWNKDIEPENIKSETIIKNTLNKLKISYNEYWDQLVIEPGTLKTKTNENYRVFTPFSRSWMNKVLDNDYSIDKIISKENLILNRRINSFFISNINLDKDLNLINNINLNFNGYEVCPCKPGEKNAKDQLTKFVDFDNFKNQHLFRKNEYVKSIYEYDKNRDIPSFIGTSYLSAALSIGTISPRTVWNSTINSIKFALAENNSELIKSVQTWQKELIWREFYQHSLYSFPELAIGPFREKWNKFPWGNNQKMYEAWREGNTGVPIIDAAMRQLSTSGWMHNRSRMIVASFLVKDLICDWRLGEKYFMQKLVDGDLASNNGGWQWSASSGMDPKPLRIFNPYTQAAKFDKKAEYIKRWIPELRRVSTNDLISGEISPLERNGYPSPIVVHKDQQALFKKLYRNLAS